jgi:hypothetical protein
MIVIVAWVAVLRNTQHTTHNTQHTTHNTQHTTHNTQHTTHNTQHTTTLSTLHSHITKLHYHTTTTHNNITQSRKRKTPHHYVEHIRKYNITVLSCLTPLISLHTFSHLSLHLIYPAFINSLTLNEHDREKECVPFVVASSRNINNALREPACSACASGQQDEERRQIWARKGVRTISTRFWDLNL